MSDEQAEKIRQELRNHNELVCGLISRLILELKTRALWHDRSKFEPPEFEHFLIYTPKLKKTTYGSDAYKEFLRQLKPALDHHYKANRHHTEHFTQGIRGMNLVDLIEMFCDWMAATARHTDGDIRRSIEQNKTRFGYDDIVADIFANTADWLETST